MPLWRWASQTRLRMGLLVQVVTWPSLNIPSCWKKRVLRSLALLLVWSIHLLPLRILVRDFLVFVLSGCDADILCMIKSSISSDFCWYPYFCPSCVSWPQVIDASGICRKGAQAVLRNRSWGKWEIARNFLIATSVYMNHSIRSQATHLCKFLRIDMPFCVRLTETPPASQRNGWLDPLRFFPIPTNKIESNCYPNFCELYCTLHDGIIQLWTHRIKKSPVRSIIQASIILTPAVRSPRRFRLHKHTHPFHDHVERPDWMEMLFQ